MSGRASEQPPESGVEFAEARAPQGAAGALDPC